MTEEPQFAPWGIASAQFWADDQAATSAAGELPGKHPHAYPVLTTTEANASAETEQPPPPPEEYRERVAAITATFAPPHDPCDFLPRCHHHFSSVCPQPSQVRA